MVIEDDCRLQIRFMQLFNPKSKVRVQCNSIFLCTLQLALELVQTIHTLGEDWGNHSFIHSFIGQTRACPMVVKFENIGTKMWSPEDFIMQLGVELSLFCPRQFGWL